MKGLTVLVEEQIEKVRYTFEQICPQWSKHLNIPSKFGFPGRASDFIGTDGKHYNIVAATRCVVGEAWGGSDDYWRKGSGRYCKDCDGFGNGPHNFIYIYDNAQMEAFTQHMNAAHSDILQSRDSRNIK